VCDESHAYLATVHSVDELRNASSCCRRAASSLSSLLCSVFSLIYTCKCSN
jgi:hypothetical protein